MKKEFDHIEEASVISLADLVDYNKECIAIHTFVNNDRTCYRLMAFDSNQSTGVHTPLGDAFLTVLDGSAHITIDDKTFTVNAGQSLLMPANHPHNVSAKVPCKISLLVAFSEKQYIPTSNLDESEFVPKPLYDSPLDPDVQQQALNMNDDSREMIHDGRF